MTNSKDDPELRVLFVDDSPDDVTLVLHELRKAGWSPTAARVEDEEGMRSALERSGWDIVLCDSSMPLFGAGRALALLHESGLDVPLISVSGRRDGAISEAMHLGAKDFVSKDRLQRLPEVIERELRPQRSRFPVRTGPPDPRSSDRALHAATPQAIGTAHPSAPPSPSADHGIPSSSDDEGEALRGLALEVARDFEGTLAAIAARAAIVLDDLPAGSPTRRHVEEIASHARVGSRLTQRIATFVESPARPGESMGAFLRDLQMLLASRES